MCVPQLEQFEDQEKDSAAIEPEGDAGQDVAEELEEEAEEEEEEENDDA